MNLILKNRPPQAVLNLTIRPKAEWQGKVTEVSIILNAANREAESTVADAHTGIAAEEVQAARVSATNGTTPVDAAGTNIAERTTTAAAVAGCG